MEVNATAVTKINGKIFKTVYDSRFENDFSEHHYQNSIRHVRISLQLAILIYGLFGILDNWIVPEVKEDLWLIRYAMFVPYALAVYFFSFTSYFKKYMQFAIASVFFFAGIGIIGMIAIAPYPGNYSYYAGLILVFFYGYTFFKLRFIWATVAGWSIVIIYELAAILIFDTPIEILVNNNFFFLAGNIIGMIACYSIEYYSRRDFLHSRLLEAEKKKVEEARQNLEKLVKDRTKQLVSVNEELVDRIAEQKIVQAALRRKVNLEQRLTNLSKRFINLRYDERRAE